MTFGLAPRQATWMSMKGWPVDIALLIGAAVLLTAVGVAKVGARVGLPSLLLFLLLGLLLGDSGLGIAFADAGMAHNLGFAALILILAEGGLTTRWSSVKTVLPLATLLATVGIVVSVTITALFAHFVLGLDAAMAVLLAACLSPTDSAAVFSVLRHAPIPDHIVAALEGESGLNDAPAVLLVITATVYATGAQPPNGIAGMIGMAAVQLIGGLLLGLAMGVIGTLLLRSFALPSPGLYPLATVGWVVMAYGVGAWIQVSGFAAVYVAAVLLGNADLPHRQATRSFGEGMGWIAQIGLFVMLGLLASPGRLTWRIALAAIAVGLVLTFISRPISVLVCALPMRVRIPDQIFMSWAGLRGAVPIILATVPMAAGVPRADELFDLVFIFVLVFTLLQAPTLGWVARRLGIADPTAGSELDVEIAPLDKIGAELLYLEVESGSKLAGVTVSELRFASSAVVSLIVRGDGSTVVPGNGTLIRTGDHLLIVTPSKHRGDVEDRLRAVSKGGRLARWRRES